MALDPGNDEYTSSLSKNTNNFWKKPQEQGGMGTNDLEVIPIIDSTIRKQMGEEE